MPDAVYNLALMLVGLSVGGVIVAALLWLILPAWWRRQDRLAALRYGRRSR